MPSLTYKEVYSRFFRRAEAYDLVFSCSDLISQIDYLSDLLHMSCSEPYVRRLFSSLVLTDEEYDEEIFDYDLGVDADYGTIEYEMNDVVDDISDKEFVLDILSYGMVAGWLRPKVNSLLNINQLIGTSDEKYYSQAQHLSELRSLLEDVEIKQLKIIRDRGYISNPYVNNIGS